MEKNIRAFFYEYKYYLFPEDCSNLSELKLRGQVTAKRLKEERCMAPDFIYESMQEETLEIEAPEHLIEVRVNLYTGAEYDEILAKQVARVCPGCERYVDDDDPSLNGHHREISLSGLCYEREDKNELWDFATSVDYFWYRISLQLNGLALCIDKGNQKQLNKIIGKELKHFFFEVDFYGAVYEGKYTLCFRTDYDHAPAVALLFDYMAAAANYKNSPIAKAGWVVKPYCPEGAYRPPKMLAEGKPVASIAPSQNAPFCLDVTLYDKHVNSGKKQKELVDEFYNDMCARIGEEKAWTSLNIAGFSADKSGMLPPEEVARALKEKYAEFYGEGAPFHSEEPAFPSPMPYGMGEGAAANALIYRGYIGEGVTRCGGLSFLERDDLKEPPFWMHSLSYAYLYIPRPADGEENAFQTVLWYFQNTELIPEPLRDPNETRTSSGCIGFADCGEKGFIVDFCVASEKGFFRMLRILAPVLQEYRAKVVMVNKEGCTAYECGYEFPPVEEK